MNTNYVSLHQSFSHKHFFAYLTFVFSFLVVSGDVQLESSVVLERFGAYLTYECSVTMYVCYVPFKVQLSLENHVTFVTM